VCAWVWVWVCARACVRACVNKVKLSNSSLTALQRLSLQRLSNGSLQALAFVPPSARLFGVWGGNQPTLVLKNPGCTSGPAPLFPWMKSHGVGIAIWQWWHGDAAPLDAIAEAVRLDSLAPTPPGTPTPPPPPPAPTPRPVSPTPKPVLPTPTPVSPTPKAPTPKPPTPQAPTPGPPPPAPTPGGGKKRCHSIAPTVTDAWCNLNCNAKPAFCPPTQCKCA
jgi:hypothetical protein